MRKLVYVPNPAHKAGTTEAGPPRWQPDKTRCPPMTLEEREQLLARSVGLRSDDDVRRYAIRPGLRGLEAYETKLTRELADGSAEVHGHPTVRVPPQVLRKLRDGGLISAAEYEQLRKELG